MLRHLILALSLACTLAAQASERVALVIGNSDYKNSPLVNPRNDANAMAELLTKAGFVVDKQLDTDLPRMQSAVDRFGTAIRDPKVKFGLFYYAGHGLQQDWRNYIVPVSARIRNAGDVTQQTVDVSGLLRYMEQAVGRSFLVVLDACRDDPFAGSFRPAAKGLTQFDAPVGSLLAYSTAPGSVAQDGEGANGLYTGFLLREFAVPGARLEDAFKRVRLSVRMASKGTQVPWESTSLEENIYLFPTVVRNLTEADRDELLEKEMTAWLKVKSSQDPEALAAYIREFPSGSASELAQSRLSRMLSIHTAQESHRRQATALASSKAAQELAAREEEARQRVAQAEEKRLASERIEAERVRLAQLDAAREETKRQQLAQEIAQREQAVRAEQERARAAELEAARVAQAQQEAARQLEQQALAAAQALERSQAEANRLQAAQESAARAQAARLAAEKAQQAQQEAQRVSAAREEAARQSQLQAQLAQAQLQRLQTLQAEKEANERALTKQAELARAEQVRQVQLQQQEAARLAAEKQSLLAAAALPSAPKVLAATPHFKGYAEHQRSYRVGDVFTISVIDAFTKISKPLVMTVTQVDVDAERVVYNDGEFVSDLMGNTTTNQRGSFSTPRQFYPAELIVGHKWQSRFKQTRPNGVVYTFQYDLKVVGKETITVPAGTFEAYKIEARGFNMDLGHRLERNIWVTPGITADIVHEIKVHKPNGRWEQNDRQELVSYVKGKD